MRVRILFRARVVFNIADRVTWPSKKTESNEFARRRICCGTPMDALTARPTITWLAAEKVVDQQDRLAAEQDSRQKL